MQKTCPVCLTTNEAIGFNLSEKEIFNLKQLGLSEHLCKTCYNKELTNLAETTKSDLIPLNKEKESLQVAYYKAYEAWKAKAELFKAIDYNLNMIKFVEKKKATIAAKKPTPSDKPIDVEKLARQILANLGTEQREAILRTFQAAQNINHQPA